MISKKDIAIIRDLAMRVAEISESPDMEHRRQLWKKHNQLEQTRPLLLLYPEKGWEEIMPESRPDKGDNGASWRKVRKFLGVTHEIDNEEAMYSALEWTLRSKLFMHENISDDSVVEKDWYVYKSLSTTGWGLTPKVSKIAEAGSAYAFVQVLNKETICQLQIPEIIFDEKKSLTNLAFYQDLVGDILNVKLTGMTRFHFPLAS